LGAVVEVALQAAPLGVAGLDDAGARAAELLLLGRALGDVDPADEYTALPAIAIPEPRTRPRPQPLLVVAAPPPFRRLRLTRVGDDPHEALGPGRVSRRGDELEEVRSGRLARGQAGQLAERMVDRLGTHRAVRAEDGEERRGGVADCAQEVALRDQRELGLLPVRDVADDGVVIVAGRDDARLQMH